MECPFCYLLWTLNFYLLYFRPFHRELSESRYSSEAGQFEGTLDTVRFWIGATDANVQRRGKDKVLNSQEVLGFYSDDYRDSVDPEIRKMKMFFLPLKWSSDRKGFTSGNLGSGRTNAVPGYD